MLRRQAAPLGLGQHRALGDAKQRVMRLIVRAGAEKGLVGRDQRQAEPIGKIDQLRLDRTLMVEAVALDFDVKALVEQLGERLHALGGEFAALAGESAVDRPFRAAGEGDQAALFRKRRERHMRVLAVLRLEPGLGG